jgi:signal transduction histidine kinase
MRLYWRIVVPFAAGLLLVIGLSTVVAIHLLGQDADRRLEAHLGTVAARMAAAGFDLNPELLDRLKVVADADVVVAGPDGAVVAATLPEPQATAAAQVAWTVAHRPDAGLVSARLGGKDFKLVSVAIGAAGSPQTLGLFAPVEPLHAARAYIGRTLAAIAVAGLLLMLGWGHVVTRSITRPIDALVAATRTVAEGNLSHRTAPSGVRELRTLGLAFDDMLAKIRDSEARLVRSERVAAMGRLTATIAHEVRNPLAAMRMLAQILSRYHARETRPGEACTKIVAEIDRLELLVRGLLEATHDRPFRPKLVDVGQLLAEIQAFLAEPLRHRHVEVALHLGPTPVRVTADPDALKQVVLNLLLNAAEAMPRGGTVTLAGPGVDGIEVAVIDEGDGLAPEVEAQAFEPFFSTKPQGTGLGLPLCRRIVEEHGGRILLANAPGRGAVATVCLPATTPSGLTSARGAVAVAG